MKKYFVKNISTDNSEIKVDDKVINHLGEVGVLIAIKHILWGFDHLVKISEKTIFSEKDEIIESRKQDLRKFGKFYLCSKDIEYGDLIQSDLYPNPERFYEFASEIPIGESDLVLKKGSKELSNYYKIIGEISSDANWLKEGMEYDSDEVQISYSCEKGMECDLHYGSQMCFAPHEILNPIKIKGPCNHFH